MLEPVMGMDPAAVAAARSIEGARKRIRVLKFLTLFGIGGTEKQVVNLAKRIDRRAFDLSFGCLSRWGELIGEVEQGQGIAVTEYPIRRLYGLHALRQQWRFARELRKGRIQIVHSYNFYGNVFSIPAAKIAGVPVVIASIRDLGIYLRPAQLRVQKWVCRFADRIVVNAEAIRDWLVADGYPMDKIVVIRNGVDVTRFGGHSDGAALRREFDLPRDAPLVVMLSRLNPKKGIECFLEAAALIHRQCPEVCFLAVGEAYARGDGEFHIDPVYRQKLQDRVMELGLGRCFRFTGMREDVPEILAAAAVSVLPSFSEGVSNTLLESMAAGVPVVATRVGGTPEVIRDKEHGLLSPPGDPEAIADSVRTLLHSPLLAARLSAQARERVVREFSFDAVVRRTQDLYLELLESKTHRGEDGYERSR
jgi:glycosyltransferase involved in cell wall biosynthesis